MEAGLSSDAAGPGIFRRSRPSTRGRATTLRGKTVTTSATMDSTAAQNPDATEPPRSIDFSDMMRIGKDTFVPAVTESEMDLWGIIANRKRVDPQQQTIPEGRRLPAHVRRIDMTDEEYDRVIAETGVTASTTDADDQGGNGEASALAEVDVEDDDDAEDDDDDAEDDDGEVHVPDILTELPTS